MKKIEEVSVKKTIYLSDISGKKINNYSNHNKCCLCGKDIHKTEIGQEEEDGVLCILCTKKGFKIVYSEGVGVEDAEGHSVSSPWL